MKDSSPIKGETSEGKNCTLSDKELTERCEWWIDKLCKSHGEAWTLRVPVDFNYDPDMVFTDLIARYKVLLEDYRRLSSDHEEALAESYAKLQVMYGEKCAELNRLSSKEDRGYSMDIVKAAFIAGRSQTPWTQFKKDHGIKQD